MIKSFDEHPDYIYTGFFIRLFAFTVDIIIIGALQRMLFVLLDDGILKTSLSLLVYLAYFILMTKLNHGQTLGKMIFGIKVICLNEENLSWNTVIVREGFGRYIQKTIWILYVLVAFTRHKQHVADILTDTSVVTLNYLRLLEENQTQKSEFISSELVTE